MDNVRVQRIQVQDVLPQVDCGRWPAKACLDDDVAVSATVFRDGHDVLRATVRYRPRGTRRYREAQLEPLGNDLFGGALRPDSLGRWQFCVQAWVDPYATWLEEHDRKVAAGQTELAGELAEGRELFGEGSIDDWRAAAPALGARSREGAVTSPLFELDVERERARFGAWYELFPRSFGGLRGVTEVLPTLADLGFDVVYLPPVHPIGTTNRKGPNNTEGARRGDPGSPWAIGSDEGGHDALDPRLGTDGDFQALVRRAKELGMDVALDFAIQCSPDHPWLREHPEWFQHRPDGSLKYAENPPKRYQDIHNVDWDSDDAEGLWQALLEVVLGWCARGIRAFRVDNPHTKPLPFWAWLISEVRDRHPEVVFLSEAFTRPAMMTALAKAGFSQSYTYFTWKNTRWELVELVEQMRGWSPYYRPNLWPNTPDILHAYLQAGGRAAFEARLVLAATLAPSYGIYSGYEACENVAVRPGSEEYVDSEKYELKERKIAGPLLPLIARLNRVRRDHPALHRFDNLAWLETGNDQLVGYTKRTDDDVALVVVNLDFLKPHEGACVVPSELGFSPTFAVEDALDDQRYVWHTGANYVKLPPGGAHVLTLGRDL